MTSCSSVVGPTLVATHSNVSRRSARLHKPSKVGPCPLLQPYLQLEQLQDVRPRHVRELVVRVQGFAQALQGAEGAQHEGERRREAEGLVDGDRKQVLTDRLRSRLASVLVNNIETSAFIQKGMTVLVI